jgi:hypothetical protein
MPSTAREENNKKTLAMEWAKVLLDISYANKAGEQLVHGMTTLFQVQQPDATPLWKYSIIYILILSRLEIVVNIFFLSTCKDFFIRIFDL